jgi:hypothetical protein
LDTVFFGGDVMENQEPVQLSSVAGGSIVKFCEETPTNDPEISFPLGQRAIVVSDQPHPDHSMTVEVPRLGSFLVGDDTMVVVVEDLETSVAN